LYGPPWGEKGTFFLDFYVIKKHVLILRKNGMGQLIHLSTLTGIEKSPHGCLMVRYRWG
jgi:hypothetical protein